MKFKSNLQILFTILSEIALAVTIISLFGLATLALVYMYIPIHEIADLNQFVFKTAISGVCATFVFVFVAICVGPSNPEKR